MSISASEGFEAERPRLVAVATRILGSSAEADDVVQEAWLRLTRVDLEEVESLPAWLTRVVTRLCLDHFRRRVPRAAAETAAAAAATVGTDPETDAVVADRVAAALQLVLDTLAPAERAAFVLHDVFGYSFDEISDVLGRSGTAVRQLASRARRKVQGGSDTAEERVGRVEHRQVIDAFLAAARGGDLPAMLSLLAPEATMRADAVGQRMGTDPEYRGAEAVAARFNGAKGALPVTIDGELGAAWIMAGEVKVAFVFHVSGGVVSEVELIADPEVLATLEVARVRGHRWQ